MFQSSGDLVKKQILTLGVKEGRQRVCIFIYNKLPGDADVAGLEDRPGTTELPAHSSSTLEIEVSLEALA